MNIIVISADEDRKRARYADCLQRRGKIKTYRKHGLKAYDLEEYQAYRENARVGRPLEMKREQVKQRKTKKDSM